MNETAFQIALLSATLAGPKRDPLAYIEQARALLRACQEPATAPVESNPRLVSYDDAEGMICPEPDKALRRKRMIEFFRPEVLRIQALSANPGEWVKGDGWEQPPGPILTEKDARDQAQAEALAAVAPVTAYIASLKASGLSTNQVADLAERFRVWKKEQVSAIRTEIGKRGGNQTKLKKQKR